jgi:DNA replication protein DnaC
MDKKAKERMQQAIEDAKRRREHICDDPQPLGNLLPTLPKIVALTGVYPEFLFETQPSNYSRNPDDLMYLCPTCGQCFGVIRKSNGYRRRPCQCMQDEYDRQDRLRFQESVRQERLAVPVKERVTYTWLGMDYSALAEHSLSNFEMQYQRNAFTLVAGYVKQNLARSAEKDNLLIYGEKAGLGKTHLAAALLNLCYEDGYSCLFMLAKDYFDALWASDFKDRLALRQRASKADFLLIDDIDKAEQKDTSAQKSEFFQLLNLRYEAGRPTFFTANSADLSRWFNEWTISRVQERLLRIPVAGKDYREIRAERARQGINAG